MRTQYTRPIKISSSLFELHDTVIAKPAYICNDTDIPIRIRKAQAARRVIKSFSLPLDAAEKLKNSPTIINIIATNLPVKIARGIRTFFVKKESPKRINRGRRKKNHSRIFTINLKGCIMNMKGWRRLWRIHPTISIGQERIRATRAAS